MLPALAILPVLALSPPRPHLDNHVGVNDDEQGAPVWICQQLTTTWQAIWPAQKHFD